jgi:flagellar assembly protein FliH
VSLPARRALREEIEQQVRAEMSGELQARYDEVYQQAHAAGLDAATTTARQAAVEAMECERVEMRHQVMSALSALHEAHEAALSQLQTEVGEIAFAAVCRLVGERGSSREFVLSLVARTCAHLRSDAIATVRLHPRDIDTLSGLLQQQQLSMESLHLKVVSDESLKLGGCVVEAPSGHYDGGLEEQLQRLHAVLNRDGRNA